MDKKGITVDNKLHIRLTSVRPGKVCRRVGISNPGPGRFGRHHGPRKHRRGFGGGFFGNEEQRRRRQEQWEQRQKEWKQDWEQGKVEWHQRGGRGITKRLLDLGLTKGCTFKVVQGSGKGPILVEVRGTRIALGHQLASRVIVEIVEE